MIAVKGLKDQEKLNSYIRETLHNYSKEKDDSLEMRLEQIKEIPQGVVIHLRGYLDMTNSNYFKKQVRKLYNSCLTKVIFEMKNLTYISSTGVGSFIQFLKDVRNVNGDIVLVDMQKHVASVMELLGLIGFFNKEDNIEEGIEVLKHQLN